MNTEHATDELEGFEARLLDMLTGAIEDGDLPEPHVEDADDESGHGKAGRRVILLAAALLIGAGTYQFYVNLVAPSPELDAVTCMAEADVQAPRLSGQTTGNPIDYCRTRWEAGEVVDRDPGQDAPPLVACVLDGRAEVDAGEAAVFPGSPGTCAELGLEPLDVEAWMAHARPYAALRDDLTAAFEQPNCHDGAEASRIVRDILEEHGRHWPVQVRRADHNPVGCAQVHIDSEHDRVVVAFPEDRMPGDEDEVATGRIRDVSWTLAVQPASAGDTCTRIQLDAGTARTPTIASCHHLDVAADRIFHVTNPVFGPPDRRVVYGFAGQQVGEVQVTWSDGTSVTVPTYELPDDAGLHGAGFFMAIPDDPRTDYVRLTGVDHEGQAVDVHGAPASPSPSP